MDRLKISEVADRTGLTASALRFYENAGIVAPDRAANGYRVYSDTDVDALLFITRAKAVGLSLDEIAELLHLRDTDRCAPLQDRLTELVATRLADTRARATELAIFTNDLESLLRQLSMHQPDGPCDDDCGCLTASRTSQALVAEVQDVCSLERSQLPKRLDDWQRLLAGCDIIRDRTGATITLSPEVSLGTVADLVAAETECCSFFTFDIRVDTTGMTLRVTAPPSQQAMIDVVVGAAT